MFFLKKLKKQGRNRSFCLVSGGDMRDRTADLLNAIQPHIPNWKEILENTEE
jgi:hypothetical protein